MKQSISYFEFYEKDGISKLSYKRTFKDWFDILSSLLIALLCLSVVIFLMVKLSEELDWFYIFIIGVFGFIAFLKFSYTIGRLLEPTKEFIEIDKDKNVVNIRITPLKKIALKISELSLISYHLNSDTVTYSDPDSATVIKNRFWIEVDLLTKNKEVIKVLKINPSDFFQRKDNETREELLSRSKILVQKLSNELGVKSKYKNFRDLKN